MNMSITLDKILERMQAELNRAQGTGNVQKKREHLAAMKSLCELALESESEGNTGAAGRSAGAAKSQQMPVMNAYQAPSYAPPAPSPQVSNMPSKPMKEEDANGDSLFDF
jgi:hypothetical protein